MRLPANLTWVSIWVGAVLFGLILRIIEPAFLQRLENQLYDWRLRHAPVAVRDSRAAIVAVDEKSLEAVGRWPWDRRVIARLLDKIFEAGARSVAIDIVFSEPQRDNAAEILGLLDRGRPLDELGSMALAKPGEPDQVLAETIRRHKDQVVGGYFLHRWRAELVGLDPAVMKKAKDELATLPAITRISGEIPYWRPPKALLPELNIELLNRASRFQGHFNFEADDDGVVRRASLVMECEGRCLPSLSLAAAWAIEQTDPNIFIDRDGSVMLSVGSVRAPLNNAGSMLIPYRGPAGTIPTVSAADVLNGRAGEELRDRDVLLGCTAPGISDFRVTPFGKLYPGVEIQATVLDGLRSGVTLQEPGARHFVVDMLVILVCGVILGGAMRRISVVWGLVLGIGLLAALAWINFLVFVRAGWPMQWIAPGCTIALTYVSLAAYRYGTEERDKQRLRKAFQHYLDAPVVEEILRDHHKLNLGGEEKEVTALFCDIRGFTSFSEKLPPAMVGSFVNDYLTVMSKCIQKRRGLVDKFVGDALIAIFGALPQDSRHAEESCEAALEMLSEVSGLSQRWKERLGVPELRIGIGINTGRMIVGNFGSEDRFNYTALGAAMNAASRLEELTKEYKVPIVIGEATRQKLDASFRIRELAEVTVRGSQKPMKIFSLEGRDSA